MTEIVDLDAHLHQQFPTGSVESIPLFTERCDDVVITVIRVVHDGRRRHQIYAITQGNWSLVGIFGNYTDAMSEVLAWRRYLDSGGTLIEWQAAHNNEVYPERSGF